MFGNASVHSQLCIDSVHWIDSKIASQSRLITLFPTKITHVKFAFNIRFTPSPIMFFYAWNKTTSTATTLSALLHPSNSIQLPLHQRVHKCHSTCTASIFPWLPDGLLPRCGGRGTSPFPSSTPFCPAHPPTPFYRSMIQLPKAPNPIPVSSILDMIKLCVCNGWWAV